MDTTRIKLRLGELEVEGEGTLEFVREEFPAMIKALLEELGSQPLAANGAAPRPPVNRDGFGYGTTGAIAAKLKASSGPELILAAAAHLTLNQNSERFSRKQLADEMRTASAFFKASYIGNMSASINGLLKGNSLLEPSKDTYALSSSKAAEIVSVLKGG